MRVEMLQGARSEEKDRRIGPLEEILATVRADKDARIAQLALQLEALGQTLAGMTARAASAALWSIPTAVMSGADKGHQRHELIVVVQWRPQPRCRR